jgi:GntR family transcriptional repressor for pyruvate dehydrogenase complex
VRLSDSVAAELEKRILEGALRTGDRLPAERELALELGVSRPSLREAIQKLVSKGLLSTKHGGGTHVTNRLEAPFTNPWREMLEGHPPLQGDLLEFRQMLEGETASLAAKRATALDIKRLDTAHAALAEAFLRDDLQACIKADAYFHQVIAEAAHNALLGHLSASLLKVLEGSVATNLELLRANPKRWGKLVTQHRSIWQAIRRRQANAAGSAARDHIHFVRESMSENQAAAERLSSSLRRVGEMGCARARNPEGGTISCGAHGSAGKYARVQSQDIVAWGGAR